jgi:hypothetical protein
MTTMVTTIATEMYEICRHPLQRHRFVLALVFTLLFAPMIVTLAFLGTAVLSAFVGVVAFIAFMIWFSARVLFARFLGNAILVSDLNYPRIDAIAQEIKVALNYPKPIYIFVYEQGQFNAYLLKFFGRRAIFLNSEILESGVSDNEVRWLIGRFVGLLRARRGFWNWLITVAEHFVIFNLFLLPYERALILTGDRLALAVIGGDISSAISAMQKLVVGRQLGYSINPEGVVSQHRQVKGSFFAFMARLSSFFPHMTARYVDLVVFAKSAFPAQFTIFEAANPGLPADMANLATPGIYQSAQIGRPAQPIPPAQSTPPTRSVRPSQPVQVAPPAAATAPAQAAKQAAWYDRPEEGA